MLSKRALDKIKAAIEKIEETDEMTLVVSVGIDGIPELSGTGKTTINVNSSEQIREAAGIQTANAATVDFNNKLMRAMKQLEAEEE